MNILGFLKTSADRAGPHLGEAINRIDVDYRRLDGDAIMLGIKAWPADLPKPFKRRLTPGNYPRHLAEARLLLGPGNADFLEALATSTSRETLQTLIIGWSHELYGGADANADLTEVTALLSAHEWPLLRQLQLGYFELLYNGHGRYEALGDITALLSGMPKLESLELSGNFRLTSPLNHAGLKRLILWIDDPVTSINGGAPSRESISALLQSNLPGLETLSIDLECQQRLPGGEFKYRPTQYDIDPTWMQRSYWPAVSDIELVFNGSARNRDAVLARLQTEWPNAKIHWDAI
jgi:hypothetical protein